MLEKYFELICFIWLGFAFIVHIAMFFVTAPFGRHTSSKWGLMMNNKRGWFFMEAPSLAIMLYFIFFGESSFSSYAWLLFAFWIFHYGNRTLVYPLRIKPTEKQIPLMIVFSGIFFNVVNAGLNGYFLGNLVRPEDYDIEWLASPHFIIGFAMFVTGIFINWKSDTMLINLRKPGETGYKIPRGFLFEYVSSPNLLGEIIEWGGFAVMAWNLPALTFMAWTLANLVPRAKNHHDWYVKNFPDYPKKRKVIIPCLF